MDRSTLRRARLLSAGTVLASALVASAAGADERAGMDRPLDTPLNLKVCVYDPLGAQGQLYAYAKSLAVDAQKWNVAASVVAYADERLAAEDFRVGQCQGVVLSTIRARAFNRFIGSLDAIGAAPEVREVRTVAALLDQPKVAPLTVQGDYQVLTVFPLGATYVMVNDRGIDSVEHALGKRVAVFSVDRAQDRLVSKLGAQPVASDFFSFARQFNNGQVDIIAAPAMAVRSLELSKGLEYGGVYRFPLTQMTATVLINRKVLAAQVPDLDARISALRRFAVGEIDRSKEWLARQEKSVPDRFWLDLTAEEQARYQTLMHESRVQLTREGYYDPRMMALLKRIRCRYDPSRGECALADE